MENKNIFLLIPAYQPNQQLIRLIEDISKENTLNIIYHIIIVDDGSGSGYNNIFNQLKSNPRITVISHAINLGKGAALKTGFNHVLTHYKNVSHIVTADADGQHCVVDILALIKIAQENPDALVLGARKFNKDIPLRSLVGNKLTRLVMRFFTGLSLQDTQTGLRAWPASYAMNALRITINGYDFEMESLVRLNELSKPHIIETTIQTIYLENNQSSHFNPLLDSMRIYFVFLRYCGSGLLTALVDNIVFIIAFFVLNNLIYSQICARSAGALVSFLLSKHIVFHSQVNWRWAFFKFIALVILFGFISYGTIYFLIETIGMNVFIAKLVAELALFIASFSIQRTLIFNK